MKSEGVKDVVKWLNEQIKEAKARLEEAKSDKRSFGMFEDCGSSYDDAFIRAEQHLSTLVSVKISTEKYSKKLHHQENGK